jgi:hypothetical protein
LVRGVEVANRIHRNAGRLAHRGCAWRGVAVGGVGAGAVDEIGAARTLSKDLVGGDVARRQGLVVFEHAIVGLVGDDQVS